MTSIKKPPIRDRSRVNRKADQIRRRLHKLLASVARLRSVMTLMSAETIQILESTYTTGRILTDGNGIEKVGSEV